MLSKLQCYRYFQIMMMSNNMENVAPHVIKVVARQVQALAQEKMEGINLVVNEDDMTDIQVRTSPFNVKDLMLFLCRLL